LDDGLFARLDNRHHNHPGDDWNEEKYDRIWYTEKEANEPGDSVQRSECVDGIFSDTFFAHDESSDDKGKREKSP
jgi:hypothetical protein